MDGARADEQRADEARADEAWRVHSCIHRAMTAPDCKGLQHIRRAHGAADERPLVAPLGLERALVLHAARRDVVSSEEDRTQSC